MTISKNGYETLLMVRELEEVEVSTLVERLPDVNVKNAIASLKRGKLIESVRLVHRKFIDSRSTRIIPFSVYAITGTGIDAMRKFEAAAARKLAISQGAPPKRKTATPRPPKQELYQMQNFIIPERNPAVTEQFVEHEGRTVKVTHGIGHAYEKLKLEPDSTRYRARQVRGIHAL
jgi:hypothetical protein